MSLQPTDRRRTLGYWPDWGKEKRLQLQSSIFHQVFHQDFIRSGYQIRKNRTSMVMLEHDRMKLQWNYTTVQVQTSQGKQTCQLQTQAILILKAYNIQELFTCDFSMKGKLLLCNSRAWKERKNIYLCYTRVRGLKILLYFSWNWMWSQVRSQRRDYKGLWGYDDRVMTDSHEEAC